MVVCILVYGLIIVLVKWWNFDKFLIIGLKLVIKKFEFVCISIKFIMVLMVFLIIVVVFFLSRM